MTDYDWSPEGVAAMNARIQAGITIDRVEVLEHDGEPIGLWLYRGGTVRDVWQLPAHCINRHLRRHDPT